MSEEVQAAAGLLDEIAQLRQRVHQLANEVMAARAGRDTADFRATILAARLGAYEAQCAAQVEVLQQVAAFMGAPAEYPTGYSGLRKLAERVRDVIESSTAGATLLAELAAARAVVAAARRPLGVLTRDPEMHARLAALSTALARYDQAVKGGQT